MVAIIGGDFRRFRPLVDLYREAGRRAGHAAETLRVGVHAMGFVGDTDQAAKDAFFPGWAHMFTEIGRERGWSPPRAPVSTRCAAPWRVPDRRPADRRRARSLARARRSAAFRG